MTEHRNIQPSLTPGSRALTPRWGWQSVLLAGGVTAVVYLALPGLELLSHPPEKEMKTRSVGTVELPPPPPPPPKRRDPPAERPERDSTEPKLRMPRRTLAPLQAVMDLNMAMGNVGGDFTMNFGLTSEELTEQTGSLVFELSQLDEHPRPLTQLKPIYPPGARRRNIEGHVVLNFVVTEEGETRDIAVVSEDPAAVFTQAAKSAVARWRFAPGTRGGKPVSTRVQQTVRFTLK